MAQMHNKFHHNEFQSAAVGNIENIINLRKNNYKIIKPDMNLFSLLGYVEEIFLHSLYCKFAMNNDTYIYEVDSKKLLQTP